MAASEADDDATAAALRFLRSMGVRERERTSEGEGGRAVATRRLSPFTGLINGADDGVRPPHSVRGLRAVGHCWPV